MSDTAQRVSRRYRLQRSQGRPIAFWGVILLATTEAMMFANFIFSYFYLWSVSPTWPPGDITPPSLWFVSIRSVALLSSSFTAWRAEKSLEHGRRAGTWAWTIGTILLAAFFLGGHIHEMGKLPSEFLWSDNAYGSLYYTILNFHGAHVAVGIAIWFFMLIRMGRGAYGPEDMTQFKTASIYWHFVDAVWVFLFPTLYILPNVLGGGR